MPLPSAVSPTRNYGMLSGFNSSSGSSTEELEEYSPQAPIGGRYSPRSIGDGLVSVDQPNLLNELSVVYITGMNPKVTRVGLIDRLSEYAARYDRLEFNQAEKSAIVFYNNEDDANVVAQLFDQAARARNSPLSASLITKGQAIEFIQHW